MKCPKCDSELEPTKDNPDYLMCYNCIKGYSREELECEYCHNQRTGFYVLYEWSAELQTSVTVTGAYLCDDCKTNLGYDE